MKPFTVHQGIVATLDKANIDTDAIIPKQFLKSVSRTGFGPQLFFDWRYLPDGRPDPAFRLNEPRFARASILVARNNFGCGSSREHAVWAIDQYGFRAIIAPYVSSGSTRVPAFADIFRNNAFKNGILPIELSENEVQKIFDAVEKNPGLQGTVDLKAQTVTLGTSAPIAFSFEIDPALKEKLLNGLDDIGLSLLKEKEIAAYEAKRSEF